MAVRTGYWSAGLRTGSASDNNGILYSRSSSDGTDELGVDVNCEVADRDWTSESQDRGLTLSRACGVAWVFKVDRMGRVVEVGVVVAGAEVVRVNSSESCAGNGSTIFSVVSSGPSVHRHSQRRLTRC